jgi:dihydrofolate reductase
VNNARFELVVAVSENDVIGRGNALPWHLPADLRRFRQVTIGHTVLMGRRTHESIGKALPGRLNLILTRSPSFVAEGCVVVGSLREAALVAGPDPELMVIGGAQLYRECLPLATCIHLTIVHTHIADGDAFFDGWRGPEWRETSRTRFEPDEKNALAYSFVTLLRESPMLGS